MRLDSINPVLDRELRQRSRSRRSMIILSLFLALMIAVMYLAYQGSQVSARFEFDPLSSLTVHTGRTMFEWVLATELLILLFIIPGISAATVAGERERQTLIPLQVTLVGPVQIFVGKVLASSSFLVLLLLATAPVLAVPYLVGGISLTQVLLSLATLAVIGFLIAIIGVGCSALFRRTQTATMATYAIVLAMVFGTLILLAVAAVVDNARGNDVVDPPLATLYANPFLAVTDTAGSVTAQSGRMSLPFGPIKSIIQETQGGTVVFEGGQAFDARTGQPVDIDIDTANGLPLWARSLLAQAAIAAVFAVIGIRRLRAPRKELTG